MEKKRKEEEEIPREKIKRAARLLIFKKHKLPGVRGWELKKILGKNYLRIIEVLKDELEDLGLTIKVLFEDESKKDFDNAIFFVVLKEHPSFIETRASGLRIDELAAFAATLAYIMARGGKAPLKEIEKMLERKLIRPRVSQAIDKMVRMGYIDVDEKGIVRISWRTQVEIDRKTLMDLLLSKSPKSSK